jgi:hypothetical protein
MWVNLRDGYANDQIDRLVWGITGQKPPLIGSSGPAQNPAATKWILVAGSGGITPVPARIEAVSKRLGEALATTGFSLVTGGWSGVDNYVARAFAEQIQQNGQSLSGRLVQVMQEGALPHFPAGRLVSGGSEDEAWNRSIERADAVVLVGGSEEPIALVNRHCRWASSCFLLPTHAIQMVRMPTLTNSTSLCCGNGIEIPYRAFFPKTNFSR